MATETVALQGELDFETAFDVEMRLEQAIGRADVVVVDLSGLDFIDSTGIGTLLEAHKAAQRQGTSLKLLPGKPPVQRVFEVAGLLDALPFAA
jgi:anti-sigma B factor antagonist